MGKTKLDETWAGSLLTTVLYHELFEKKIIRYFGASDIITPLRKLGSKLEKDYIFSLGPFHLLVRLFSRQFSPVFAL